MEYNENQPARRSAAGEGLDACDDGCHFCEGPETD